MGRLTEEELTQSPPKERPLTDRYYDLGYKSALTDLLHQIRNEDLSVICRVNEKANELRAKLPNG